MPVIFWKDPNCKLTTDTYIVSIGMGRYYSDLEQVF
jgi:hypothetical protein